MPLRHRVGRSAKNAVLSSIFAASESEQSADSSAENQPKESSSAAAVVVAGDSTAGLIRFPSINTAAAYSVRSIHWLPIEKEDSCSREGRVEECGDIKSVATVFLRLDETTTAQPQQQQKEQDGCSARQTEERQRQQKEQRADTTWWKHVTTRIAHVPRCSGRVPRVGWHVFARDGSFGQWRRAVVVAATACDPSTDSLLRLFFIDRGYSACCSSCLCVPLAGDGVFTADWSLPASSSILQHPPPASGVVCRLEGVSNVSPHPPTSSSNGGSTHSRLLEHLLQVVTRSGGGGSGGGGKLRCVRATFVSAHDSGAVVTAESVSGAVRGTGFSVLLTVICSPTEIGCSTVRVSKPHSSDRAATSRWSVEDCLVENYSCDGSGDLWLSVNQMLSSVANLAFTSETLMERLMVTTQLAQVIQTVQRWCRETGGSESVPGSCQDSVTEFSRADETYRRSSLLTTASTVQQSKEANVSDWLRNTNSSLDSLRIRDSNPPSSSSSSPLPSRRGASVKNKHKRIGEPLIDSVPSHHKAILHKYSSLVPVWHCRPIYRSAYDLCSSLTRRDLQLVNIRAIDRLFIAQSGDNFEQFELELNRVYDRLPLHPRQLEAADGGFLTLRQLYEPGSYWVARWEELESGGSGAQWGRVSVLELLEPDRQLRVYWVDYGEVSTVSTHQLRPISEVLAARPVLLTEAFCADFAATDSVHQCDASVLERFMQLVDTASVFIRTLAAQTTERRLAIVVLITQGDSEQMVSVIQLLAKEFGVPIWRPPDAETVPGRSAPAPAFDQSDHEESCGSLGPIVCEVCGVAPPRYDILPRTDSLVYIMLTDLVSSGGGGHSNTDTNKNDNNNNNSGVVDCFFHAVLPFGPLDAATINKAGRNSGYSRQLDCSRCHTLESISRKLLALLGSVNHDGERSSRGGRERARRRQLSEEPRCGMILAVWWEGVWRRARVVDVTVSSSVLTTSEAVAASLEVDYLPARAESASDVETPPATANEEEIVKLHFLDWGGFLTLPKINCLLYRLPRKLQMLPQLSVTFRLRGRKDAVETTHDSDAGRELRHCLRRYMHGGEQFLLAHLVHVQTSPLLCTVDLYSRDGLVQVE